MCMCSFCSSVCMLTVVLISLFNKLDWLDSLEFEWWFDSETEDWKLVIFNLKVQRILSVVFLWYFPKWDKWIFKCLERIYLENILLKGLPCFFPPQSDSNKGTFYISSGYYFSDMTLNILGPRQKLSFTEAYSSRFHYAVSKMWNNHFYSNNREAICTRRLLPPEGCDVTDAGYTGKHRRGSCLPYLTSARSQDLSVLNNGGELIRPSLLFCSPSIQSSSMLLYQSDSVVQNFFICILPFLLI